jgi:glycosyltransferase involved in cell wall biosynthesis
MKSEYTDLTILLPCLNESETLAICITKAKKSLELSDLIGEILVADNGSSDGSQDIATNLGARVIEVATKGYGATLISGINSTRSKWIIMGDSDDSYALDELDLFIQALKDGNDLVIGNRFKGGIYPGAMPWLHKYIGNPILSSIGRRFFKIPIHDFHCGLRAFKTESIKRLNLKSNGMEFASEMIVKAAINKLIIKEVPTTLKPDGRTRKPHLKTWSDGWRHLVFLLLASPKWLFFYPGLFIFITAATGIGFLLDGPLNLYNLQFNLNSMLFLIGALLLATQIMFFGFLSNIFLINNGLLPKSNLIQRLDRILSIEKGGAIGLILLTFSLFCFGLLLKNWNGNSFSDIDMNAAIRVSGLIILTSSLGMQIIFVSFFSKMLQSK